MELTEFLNRVASEVMSARDQFPNPAGSMTALTEEVGELAKAMLDETSERVSAEAIQVAAMAARVAIEGDPTLAIVRAERGAEIGQAEKSARHMIKSNQNSAD